MILCGHLASCIFSHLPRASCRMGCEGAVHISDYSRSIVRPDSAPPQHLAPPRAVGLTPPTLK